jgi:hypothetical protein
VCYFARLLLSTFSQSSIFFFAALQPPQVRQNSWLGHPPANRGFGSTCKNSLVATAKSSAWQAQGNAQPSSLAKAAPVLSPTTYDRATDSRSTERQKKEIGSGKRS